ncbi:hypothetical protein EPO33_01695 [Patescibacteria group bacterium]|nr:MAG: hypothetical protein EPO33_01695 [Patescibacteria group bacterium]
MNNRPGFSLIISVTIIGTVLMLVAISATRVLLQQLSTSVGLDDHIAAKYLAEGCAEQALLRLSEDAQYAGNETIIIDGLSCTIRPKELSGSNTVFTTEVEVNARLYRLRVELSSTNPITILSWERVASF